MHAIVSAFFSFVQWALSAIWICTVIFGISRLAFYLIRSGGAGRPIGGVILLALASGLALHWLGPDRWAALRFIDGAVGAVLLTAMAIGALMLLADAWKAKLPSNQAYP